MLVRDDYPILISEILILAISLSAIGILAIVVATVSPLVKLVVTTSEIPLIRLVLATYFFRAITSSATPRPLIYLVTAEVTSFSSEAIDTPDCNVTSNY